MNTLTINEHSKYLIWKHRSHARRFVLKDTFIIIHLLDIIVMFLWNKWFFKAKLRAKAINFDFYNIRFTKGSSYLTLLASGMHTLVKLIVMDKGEFHSDLFTIWNNAKGVEKTTPGKHTHTQWDSSLLGACWRIK